MSIAYTLTVSRSLEQVRCCIAQKIDALVQRYDCGFVSDDEWDQVFALHAKLQAVEYNLDHYGEYYHWRVCVSGNLKDCVGTLRFNGTDITTITVPESPIDPDYGNYEAVRAELMLALRQFFTKTEPNCSRFPLWIVTPCENCVDVYLHPYYERFSLMDWPTEMSEWAFDFELQENTCTPLPPPPPEETPPLEIPLSITPEKVSDGAAVYSVSNKCVDTKALDHLFASLLASCCDCEVVNTPPSNYIGVAPSGCACDCGVDCFGYNLPAVEAILLTVGEFSNDFSNAFTT